jgi:hypothetical protein
VVQSQLLVPSLSHERVTLAVRLNAILGRQYRFSPQIEPSVFVFWENMTYYSNSIPVPVRLNYVVKRYLQNKKTGRAIYDRDSR